MGATAAMLLVTLGVTWAYFKRQPAADGRVFKTSILPPEKSSFGQIAVSPDGRHLAFTATTGGKEQLWVRELDSTEARALAGTQGATYPFWSPDSRFIGFFADGRLKKIEFTGGPVQTLYEVLGTPFGGAWSRAGTILCVHPRVELWRISATGGEVTQVTTLDRSRQEGGHTFPTFLPDDHHFLNGQRRQYLWVDRRGQQINSLDVAAGNFQFWLSPDEKRFIADRLDTQPGNLDLGLCDVSGGKTERFTFDPAADFNPIWSPDGSRIVWTSIRDGIANLYQKAASGAGEDTLLWKSDNTKVPTDWSRDGHFIIYHEFDPKTKRDAWVLPVTGSGEKKPFRALGTEANEMAGTLSPDGRWLAYASDASGRYEVYVQSFPGGVGMRQVSNGGGIGPRWRRDGRELFYYAGDGKLMAAPVRSGESFEMGAAVSLFEFRAGTIQLITPYAVTGDGQRFLINAVVETEPNAPLTVVVNWAAGAST